MKRYIIKYEKEKNELKIRENELNNIYEKNHI